MPKAWAGLSSITSSDYEALEDRQFADPQFSAALSIVDETFTVSDTLCHSLHFIPRGNLTSSANLAIYTGAGSTGTLLTCTTTTGSLSTGQVRVRQRSGKLEFHADQTGATLYATYTARVSNIDAALIAQMYYALKAGGGTGGTSSEIFVAGEDVVAGPGYISGGLVYQATPSDITKCGWVWIVSSTLSGNSATIYRSGKVTPRRTMPVSTPIYCGHNGDVTWVSDEEVSAQLINGDYWHCIGVSDDGVTLNLNTLQDARRQ